MSRIAYVNGRFLPHARARIHIEDRGYQFADAVYEVWSVRDGVLLDEAGHLNRLDRSLAELSIGKPCTTASLRLIIRELLRRNRLRDGQVYLQISRGVARRDHAFPHPDTPPAIVLTAKRVDVAASDKRAEEGVGVITRADERWARCDIKTVNLLPNVLAKQAAKEAGAAEAWLLDADGLVHEGSSSNAWIVTADGKLVTHPATNDILHGITRAQVLELAHKEGMAVEERAFTLEEALAAREAFMTSASTFVTPIISIDGKPVGNGAPGSLSTSLRTSYLKACASDNSFQTK